MMIQAWRTRAGWSQEKLSRTLEISSKYIGQIEQHARVPSPDLCIRIGAVLRDLGGVGEADPLRLLAHFHPELAAALVGEVTRREVDDLAGLLEYAGARRRAMDPATWKPLFPKPAA